MSFNVIAENEILMKISEFTKYSVICIVVADFVITLLVPAESVHCCVCRYHQSPVVQSCS